MLTQTTQHFHMLFDMIFCFYNTYYGHKELCHPKIKEMRLHSPLKYSHQVKPDSLQISKISISVDNSGCIERSLLKGILNSW